MPTICILCAMKAMAAGKEPPTFDEDPMEHARRVHPDAQVAQRERAAAEAQIMAAFKAKRIS
jgi:hypothetical protein